MTTLPIDESTAEAAQLLPHQQPSSMVTPPQSQKQEELQPDVLSVEPPVIAWRAHMINHVKKRLINEKEVVIRPIPDRLSVGDFCSGFCEELDEAWCH